MSNGNPGNSTILKTDMELANTREKLRELEERYETRLNETATNQRVQELTLQSLKQMINQMKEEVTLYEIRQPAGRHG